LAAEHGSGYEIGLYAEMLSTSPVIHDSNLAALYGVTTKRLNEQVNRNADRFPDDFMFELTQQENSVLRSQNATSRAYGGLRYLPRVFTEHGALIAANQNGICKTRIANNYGRGTKYDLAVRNILHRRALEQNRKKNIPMILVGSPDSNAGAVNGQVQHSARLCGLCRLHKNLLLRR
jgi:hypothetical protein